VAQAAAPDSTIAAVLVAVGLAVLLVVPGFIFLYVLDQRGLLPEESVDEVKQPTG
jgi:cytochrome d ubiquinol oxidase subunit II